MGLSPKSSRRNVHFKDQKQQQQQQQQQNMPSYPNQQTHQSNQLSGANYGNPQNPQTHKGGPICQCGTKNYCNIHKQPTSNNAQKKASKDRNNSNSANAAQGGYNTTTVPPYQYGNNSAPGAPNQPLGIPPAVLAYINSKQCPSLVPNAKFAYELLHSYNHGNVDSSNLVFNEYDLDDDVDDCSDNDDEEEDYDQLISCSEWGDVSEISYRPLPPHNNDDLTTETESVMSAALPNRRPGQRMNGNIMGMRGSSGGPPVNRGGAGYDSSMVTSECETNSMLDTTDDDATTRFSSSTDRNFPSRLLPPSARHRPRKKRRKPFKPPRMGQGRASSFSSITDSTMSLNIITVTLSMETTSFLGISIVGQTHKQGDGGIYVGTIMPGGAVAQDGRIEPGDMILQVNEFSFENMSNDDAVKILRDVVIRPGPIKLVVAKCWNPSPQSYITLPKNPTNNGGHFGGGNNISTAGDPDAWVERTRMMAMNKGSGSGPISPSLASVTSDGSFTSSLPESSVTHPNGNRYNDNADYLLAAVTGAGPMPPSSMAGNVPTFPGSYQNSNNSSGGGSVGTPGSGNGPPMVGSGSNNGNPMYNRSGPGGGYPMDFDMSNIHLSIKTDVLTVLRAIQLPNSGLEIKDRMWLKITIPNAFLGHSLVDWLFEHLDGFSVRRDAHKYASKLLKDGYIKHTTGKASFSEQCYYIFNSEHAITNMNNLSYPGDNSNATVHHQGGSSHVKQRDPLEMDEENDVLAPLPYATPWGAPQYLGYQPRTGGYQGIPVQPGMMAPGFTVNELDSFGPNNQQRGIPQGINNNNAVQNSGITNGGHSSPGSSNSSNRSGAAGGGGGGNKSGRGSKGSGGGALARTPLNDSLSDLDCSASQRMGPTLSNSHKGSSEYFVDPM